MSIKNRRVRKLFALARVTHVYLSMGLFCLLLLFCVTGILLNHTSWLSGSSKDGSVTLTLPGSIGVLLNVSPENIFDDPPLSEIKTHLSEAYHLNKLSDVNIDSQAGEIIFDYKLPAGYASAIVDIHRKVIVIDYRKGSAWQIMNDLHKGRNSGLVWGWVIDLSAGLMIIFSLTGMIILFQNNKYRRTGLLCALFGMLSPFCLYWFFVPRLAGV